MCVRLTEVIGGVGAIQLKTELIYMPKRPGTPNTLVAMCDYLARKDEEGDGDCQAEQIRRQPAESPEGPKKRDSLVRGELEQADEKYHRQDKGEDPRACEKIRNECPE